MEGNRRFAVTWKGPGNSDIIVRGKPGSESVGYALTVPSTPVGVEAAYSASYWNLMWAVTRHQRSLHTGWMPEYRKHYQEE